MVSNYNKLFTPNYGFNGMNVKGLLRSKIALKRQSWSYGSIIYHWFELKPNSILILSEKVVAQ